jgi:hypothetical protein
VRAARLAAGDIEGHMVLLAGSEHEITGENGRVSRPAVVESLSPSIEINSLRPHERAGSSGSARAISSYVVHARAVANRLRIDGAVWCRSASALPADCRPLRERVVYSLLHELVRLVEAHVAVDNKRKSLSAGGRTPPSQRRSARR